MIAAKCTLRLVAEEPQMFRWRFREAPCIAFAHWVMQMKIHTRYEVYGRSSISTNKKYLHFYIYILTIWFKIIGRIEKLIFNILAVQHLLNCNKYFFFGRRLLNVFNPWIKNSNSSINNFSAYGFVSKSKIIADFLVLNL